MHPSALCETACRQNAFETSISAQQNNFGLVEVAKKT